MMGWQYIAFYVLVLTMQTDQSTPTIRLKNGAELIGTVTRGVENKDVWEFLGIPYAQAPVGDLRFKPPLPAPIWTGVLNASVYSAICSQQFKGMPLEESIRSGKVQMSEDCLYLNIIAPKSTSNDPKSVMVWIHGGSFGFGSASDPSTSGRILASQENVIVASMNYRLSIFGFLYAGISDAPGNVGLLDQLEAMKWIKENIDSFGGDPKNITLFGVSAGGASVGLHALSPLGQDFYTRVILQSGTAVNTWAVTCGGMLKSRALNVAGKVGCAEGISPVSIDIDWSSIVTCLRSKSPSELLDSFEISSEEVLQITWTPVVDGNFLPNEPIKILRDSTFKKVDVLIGTVVNEGSFFLPMYFPDIFGKADFTIDEKQFKFMINTSMVGKYHRNPAVFRSAFFEYDAYSLLNSSAAVKGFTIDQLISDVHFTSGADMWAQFYTKAGQKVFRYLFTYDKSAEKIPWMKCPHAYDQYFIFGGPLLNSTSNSSTSAVQVKLSKDMMRFWANFARSGDPNQNSDGTTTTDFWPQYSDDEAYLMLSGENNTASHSCRKRKCYFWNEHAPEIHELTKNCFQRRI